MIDFEYRLVNERTPKKLSDSVNQLLALGDNWKVHGDPIVKDTTPGFNPEFYQAMVRRAEREV